MKYKAFFSYSRKDERLAKWLWRKLDRFKTPRHLVGTIGKVGKVPASLHPIFRDRSDLESGGHVDKELQAKLEDSERLIVLCTPQSAKSEWVDHEINTFLRLGREDRIFPVIGAGEPYAENEEDECFPPSLRERNILAADLREISQPNGELIGDGKTGGKQKLIAGLLGLPLDKIVRRERQRQRALVAILSTASVLFAALAASSVVFGWMAQQSAKAERLALQEAKDQIASVISGRAIELKESDPYKAALWAIAAVNQSPETSNEARSTVLNTWQNFNSQFEAIPAMDGLLTPIQWLDYSPVSGLAAFCDAEGQLYTAYPGQQQKPIMIGDYCSASVRWRFSRAGTHLIDSLRATSFYLDARGDAANSNLSATPLQQILAESANGRFTVHEEDWSSRDGKSGVYDRLNDEWKYVLDGDYSWFLSHENKTSKKSSELFFALGHRRDDRSASIPPKCQIIRFGENFSVKDVTCPNALPRFTKLSRDASFLFTIKENAEFYGADTHFSLSQLRNDAFEEILSIDYQPAPFSLDRAPLFLGNSYLIYWRDSVEGTEKDGSYLVAVNANEPSQKITEFVPKNESLEEIRPLHDDETLLLIYNNRAPKLWHLPSESFADLATDTCECGDRLASKKVTSLEAENDLAVDGYIYFGNTIARYVTPKAPEDGEIFAFLEENDEMQTVLAELRSNSPLGKSNLVKAGAFVGLSSYAERLPCDAEQVSEESGASGYCFGSFVEGALQSKDGELRVVNTKEYEPSSIILSEGRNARILEHDSERYPGVRYRSVSFSRGDIVCEQFTDVGSISYTKTVARDLRTGDYIDLEEGTHCTVFAESNGRIKLTELSNGFSVEQLRASSEPKINIELDNMGISRTVFTDQFAIIQLSQNRTGLQRPNEFYRIDLDSGETKPLNINLESGKWEIQETGAAANYFVVSLNGQFKVVDAASEKIVLEESGRLFDIHPKAKIVAYEKDDLVILTSLEDQETLSQKKFIFWSFRFVGTTDLAIGNDKTVFNWRDFSPLGELPGTLENNWVFDEHRGNVIVSAGGSGLSMYNIDPFLWSSEQATTALCNRFILFGDDISPSSLDVDDPIRPLVSSRPDLFENVCARYAGE